MTNQLPNDLSQKVASTIQAMEVSPPPYDLATQPLKRKRTFAPILATAAGSAGLVLVLVLIAVPAPLTLAQVALAQSKVTRYRIVNTRILQSGKTFQIVSYRDGDRWSVQMPNPSYTRMMFGDKQSATSIIEKPGKPAIETTHLPPVEHFREFSVDRLLWLGKRGNAPKVTCNPGLVVNDRKVDQYLVDATYEDRGHNWRLKQEVLVDDKTKLPVKMSILRDDGQWGDTWTYDYEPLASDALDVPNLPGAHVYNASEQKEQMDRFAKQGRGVALVDENNQVLIIPPKLIRSDGSAARISLDGISGKAPETAFSNDILYLGAFKTQVRFAISPDQFKTLQSRSQISLTGTIGKTKVKFNEIPLMVTGDINEMLRRPEVSSSY